MAAARLQLVMMDIMFIVYFNVLCVIFRLTMS